LPVCRCSIDKHRPMDSRFWASQKRRRPEFHVLNPDGMWGKPLPNEAPSVRGAEVAGEMPGPGQRCHPNTQPSKTYADLKTLVQPQYIFQVEKRVSHNCLWCRLASHTKTFVKQAAANWSRSLVPWAHFSDRFLRPNSQVIRPHLHLLGPVPGPTPSLLPTHLTHPLHSALLLDDPIL
jgi:hypothetical protein